MNRLNTRMAEGGMIAFAGYLEQLDHPEVLALHARIEATATAAGIALATVRGPGRDWADLERLGYRLVVGANDVAMLVEGAHRATELRLGQSLSAPPARY